MNNKIAKRVGVVGVMGFVKTLHKTITMVLVLAMISSILPFNTKTAEAALK